MKTKMLYRKFMLLVVSSLSLCIFLKADVSSNKFDVQSIGSMRGLAGQSNFGEIVSRSAFATSFFVTPFYNSGSSSWGFSGSKATVYAKPSVTTATGTVSQGNYNYGILEENGFWDAAGLFFGFADPEFLLPFEMQNNVTDSAGGVHNMQYSTLLYFAPKNYELVTGVTYESNPYSPGIHKGQGYLPSNVQILFGDNVYWDNDHYRNFYQAFLKNIGVLDTNLKSYSQVNDLGATSGASSTSGSSGNSGTTSTTGTTTQPYTDIASSSPGIRNALMPDDYTYSSNNDINGQIILNPSICKTGCRFALGFSPYSGINFNARIGFVNLRVSGTARDAVPTSSPYLIVSNYAMLTSVLEDLGATLDDYTQAGPEDAYLNVIAGQGLNFGGGDGNLTIYPFVTGGIWAPTSKNYTAASGNKYCLYVPMGNEGHTGYSVGVGISLDFKDVLCLTLGAGSTFFNTITVQDYRMPNHKAQRGFYPFMIDMSRKRGHQLYGYASMKSINFEDGVAFYCDFVYSQHQQDNITLCDSSSERNLAFEEGRLKLQALSPWSVLEWNLGLSLTLSESARAGVGLTTNIKGVSLPSMRTLCFSAMFTF